jgi:hypothetical protein
MTFVSVDTISIEKDENNAEGMINTMDKDLKNADKKDWKIVFGHYPCHSGGCYSVYLPSYNILQEKVEPVMKKQKADFYLSGHDHNLQHWVTKDNSRGVEHITTGAGGANRYSKKDRNVRKNEAKGVELKFFEEQYGFTYFVVNKDEISVYFVNSNREVIHHFTRERR